MTELELTLLSSKKSVNLISKTYTYGKSAGTGTCTIYLAA